MALLLLLILMYTVYPLSCLVYAFSNIEHSPEGPKFLLILVSIIAQVCKVQTIL